MLPSYISSSGDSQLKLRYYLRNDFLFQFLRIIIILLDMFSSQNEFESVFDLRFCSPFDEVGDLSPFITDFEPLLEEFDILFEGPLFLVDGRIQGCKPSLTALLTVTSCVGYLFLVHSI
jgi:hypothetical protein